MSELAPNAPILQAEDAASGGAREIIQGSHPAEVFLSPHFAMQRLILPPGESSEAKLRSHTLGMNWGQARNVEYSIEGRSKMVHIPPRSGSFFPAGSSIGAKWLEDSDIVLLSLDTALAGDLKAPVEQPHPVFHSPTIDKLVRTMSAELARSDLGYEVALSSLASLTFIEILRLQGVAEKPIGRAEKLTPRQIRQLQEYIRESLGRPIALSDLASLMNLSVSHFARAFRASIGIPPARYIRQQRLEQAKQALLTTNLTMQDVASRYGFASASHFTELFRLHFGMPPSEFRRRTKS